jgi:hypothetical protein
VPSYEFETRPVRSPHRPIAVAFGAGALILLAAVAGSLVAPARAPAPARDTDAPAAAATAIPAVAINCGGLRETDCLAAVEAARRAIDDPGGDVEQARAWPTLICGDDLDCPRPLLQASDPVGSVELTLGDRAVVWVNIFRIPEPNRLNENREVIAGRVIRWFGAPA